MNQPATNIQSLQRRQQQPDNFPAMLKQFKSEIARALPRHLNPDRMARIALTAFRRTPKLGECDPRSVFAAVIQASQLGLEPDTLGRSYLIPYGSECQFVPGWKGLVELVNRSGQGIAWTGAAFEGDEFDYALGDSPFVTHKPGGEYDSNKMTHVYAIGRPKGAEWPVIEVWTVERVRKHRDRYNKVGNRHYSFQNWEMYARKVVLMQVLKYMPMSPELATAMEMSEAAEVGAQRLNVNDAIEGTWAPIYEPESTDSGRESATDQEQSQWPQSITDPETGETGWQDSAGEWFDKQRHAWSQQAGAPAVNSDGTFRKRRGTASSNDDQQSDESSDSGAPSLE